MKKMLIAKYMLVFLTSGLIKINGMELNENKIKDDLEVKKTITNYRNFIKNRKNFKIQLIKNPENVFSKIYILKTDNKIFKNLYKTENLPTTLIKLYPETNEYSNLYDPNFKKKLTKYFEYFKSDNFERKNLFQKHHIFDELLPIENIEMCKELIEKFEKDNRKICKLIMMYYQIIIEGKIMPNKIKFEIEQLFKPKKTDLETIENFRIKFKKLLKKIKIIQEFGLIKAYKILELENLILMFE